MSKKVGIFCKLNAARSPVLEAFLSHHVPNYTFFSGGILGEEGMGLPGITRDLVKSLGLSYLKDTSSNVRNQEKQIVEADLLLAADDSTCQVLEAIYPEKHFFSIERLARQMGVSLVDPVGKVGHEFNSFLGRFLYFGFASFQELEGWKNNFPILALIANQENIHSELEILLDSLSRGAINPLIVNCNFKFAAKSEYLRIIPSSERYESIASSIVNLNGNSLSSISLIGPSHEVTAWESFVSSPEWRRWLMNISRSRPVLLLCTPVDVIEGEMHNSFLEALNADRLIFRA
jgi:protein-tyrosine-phosphatase